MVEGNRDYVVFACDVVFLVACAGHRLRVSRGFL